MKYEERLKQIEDHFANISSEELERNLEKAGIGKIKSCRKSGHRLLLDNLDSVGDEE